jgi:hypothetical protein
MGRNVEIPGESRDLQVARIQIDEHGMPERRQQRLANLAGEVPHEVGAPDQLPDRPGAQAVDSRRLQRWLLVVAQKGRAIAKAIVMEATQETVDPSLVDDGIPGGSESLEPDDIVTEIEEAHEVLKQGTPVPTTSRIAGERTVSEDDPEA